MVNKTLYQTVYDTIKEEIASGTLKADDMLPTEQELAERFFTSRITIRRGLKMLVDEGHIKRVPGCGTFVKTPDKQKSGNFIGVVLSNISPIFGTEILVAIEKYATQNNYNVIFKNSFDNRELETNAIKELVASGVSGILIQPIHSINHNEELLRLSLLKFPVVFLDRMLSGLPYSCVSTDNVLAAKSSVEHLIKNGHKNIAFVSFLPRFISTLEERYEGWKQALFDNELLASPSLVCFLKYSAKLTEEQNRENYLSTLRKFFMTNPDITAVLSCEFAVCYLLYAVFPDLPQTKNISVITFDKSENHLGQNIAHILQDQENIGTTAAKTLIERIHGKSTPSKIHIPFTLIEGDTVHKL